MVFVMTFMVTQHKVIQAVSDIEIGVVMLIEFFLVVNRRSALD